MLWLKLIRISKRDPLKCENGENIELKIWFSIPNTEINDVFATVSPFTYMD